MPPPDCPQVSQTNHSGSDLPSFVKPVVPTSLPAHPLPWRDHLSSRSAPLPTPQPSTRQHELLPAQPMQPLVDNPSLSRVTSLLALWSSQLETCLQCTGRCECLNSTPDPGSSEMFTPPHRSPQPNSLWPSVFISVQWGEAQKPQGRACVRFWL